MMSQSYWVIDRLDTPTPRMNPFFGQLYPINSGVEMAAVFVDDSKG